MSDLTDLLRTLIRRPSVTPDDGGCQTLIAERLARLGFSVEWMGKGEVTNLWARRGAERPVVCFAGHTDVVPVGDPGDWTFPPFSATLDDGKCYGRGAVDMKGGLAAGIVAIERHLRDNPDSQGSIAVLLTSDEEGPAVDGTAEVVRRLKLRGETIDCALVLEPTCERQLGDTIKNGRRGSLDGTLIVEGIAGHVAYAPQATNPILAIAPLLAEWATADWDRGNADFPETTFQVTKIDADSGAANVIPDRLTLRFNFRHCPESTVDSLKNRMAEGLDSLDLSYELIWEEPSTPYLTEPGILIESLGKAIADELGLSPALSTGGGTSDGRFLAEIAREVVEFGPRTTTIHAVDEHVAIADLESLSNLYCRLLDDLLRRKTA